VKSFNGKVAAITGAGSGIGRALALALARSGCRVALSDIDAAGLAATAQQVQAAGGRATTARVDVADRAAVTCVHPGGIATNIATAQRFDPGVQQLTGLDAQAHRAQGEKLINRTQPEEAARQILEGVRRNARRVLIGSDAKALDVMVRLLGAGYQSLLLRRARRMGRTA
jgi:NAD(P)-dependent dehydrogenase (short-subunit alcohol dehydrogenase family)